jgi:hypothetical protein
MAVLVNPAFALVEALSLEELTSKSSIIIRGKVIALSSRWNEERTQILTDVTIEVSDYIKGESQGAELTIRVPGGVVEGIGMWVSDVPSFEEGQEVVLFLFGNDFEVVGGFQGKFTVEKGMVLEVGLPVEEFISGVRQTMKGSPPSWAREKPLSRFLPEATALSGKEGSFSEIRSTSVFLQPKSRDIMKRLVFFIISLAFG